MASQRMVLAKDQKGLRIQSIFSTNILDKYPKARICLDAIYEQPGSRVSFVDDGKMTYVLKRTDVLRVNEEYLGVLENEYNLAKKLGDEFPNFTKVYDFQKVNLQDSNIIRVEMLMEEAGNSLARLIDTATPQMILMWIVQSAFAYQYSETRRIVNFDIKPANMTFKNGIFRIIDMECSIQYETMASVYQKLEGNANKIAGYSKHYIPPEYLKSINNNENLVGHAVDVYCWGISFLQIILKITQNDLWKIRLTHYEYNKAQYDDKFIGMIKKSEPIKMLDPEKDRITQILVKALQYDPKDRCTFEEILEILGDLADNAYENPKIYGNMLYEIACAYEKYSGIYEKGKKFAEKSLQIRLKINGKDAIDTACSYTIAGKIYLKTNELEKALEYMNESLRIRLSKYGYESKDIAESFNELGNIYCMKGNFKESIKLITKGLEIRRKIFGEESKETAESYNDMGACYSYAEDRKNAFDYYTKALKIFQKVLTENNFELAVTYNNLALEYYRIKNYDKAKECYTKAIKIQKKTLGIDHPSMATYYANFGRLYQDNKEYANALEYYTKSLEINAKIYGNVHLRVMLDYNYLSTVCSLMKKLKECQEYSRKALEIGKIIFKENDLKLAASYKHTGDANRLNENHQEALINHFNALLIYYENYDEEDQNIIHLHKSIANDYSNKNDDIFMHKHLIKYIQLIEKVYGEFSQETFEACQYAIKIAHTGCLFYYLKIFTIQRLTLDEKHPDVILTLKSLSECYRETKDYASKLKIDLKLLKFKQESSSIKKEDLEYFYLNISEDYYRIKDSKSSEKYLNLLLNVRKQLYAESSKEISLVYENFGKLFSQSNEFNKSLENYTKALNIMLKLHNSDRDFVAKTYKTISVIYQKLGKLDKSTEMLQSAYKIYPQNHYFWQQEETKNKFN